MFVLFVLLCLGFYSLEWYALLLFSYQIFLIFMNYQHFLSLCINIDFVFLSVSLVGMIKKRFAPRIYGLLNVDVLMTIAPTAWPFEYSFFYQCPYYFTTFIIYQLNMHFTHQYPFYILVPQTEVQMFQLYNEILHEL
jgi:hypothetical protein